jgi:hypothetical protein
MLDWRAAGSMQRAGETVYAVVLLLAACCPLLAQEAAPPQTVSVIVPVVGNTDGPNNMRWKTDIELHNDLRTEATVSLALPTAPDQPAIITTIPPGQTVRFPDIVGQTFGFERVLSPLVVETMGRRSVTIRATAYGMRGTEIFQPQPISINYQSGVASPLRMLNGLSFSDTYRTNIGLANLGSEPATFTLALQRLANRNVAISRIPVAPNTLYHIAIQTLFPLITAGDDFSIIVEGSSPDTYVYASVIDNETNAAHFVQPLIAPATTASR